MKIIIFILALTQFIGCGGNQESNEQLLTLNPLSCAKITNDNVANFVEDVKFIPLEPTDNSLVSHVKKVITAKNGDLIVQDKSGIIQFAKDGGFIRRIGQKGRANNEYIELGSICIDASNNTLYILDAMGKVLCYNVESGNYIRTIKPQFGNTQIGLDDILPSTNGGFYILSCNTNGSKGGKAENTIYKFTSEGIKVDDLMPVKDFMITMFLSSQSYNNRYLVRPFDNKNIVYLNDKGALTPYCYINFGDNNIPEGAVYNASGEMDLGGYFEANYYKFPSQFQETMELMAFVCAGAKNSSVSFIFNKKSGKGLKLVAPDQMTVPFSAAVSDNDYLYFVDYKYSKENLDLYADPVIKYITEKYGTLSEGDNPRLVGVKFKF